MQPATTIHTEKNFETTFNVAYCYCAKKGI